MSAGVVTLVAAAGFLLSLWLLLEGAEWFTKGVLITSRAAGVPAATVAFLAGGIDFDNLAVGVTAAVRGLPEIATASVVGSTFFFITGGVGIALMIAPIPARLNADVAAASLLPPLSLVALGSNGVLTRIDALLLLGVSLGAIVYILTRGERRRKARSGSLASAALRLAGSLVAIVVGAELFRWSVTILLQDFDLDQTWFGMVFVGAAVTVEEIPKIAGPARAGYPLVALANVAGTLVFNAGINPSIIALIAPLPFANANVQGWSNGLAVATVAVLLWISQRQSTRLTGGVLLVVWLVAVSAMGML